MTTTIILTAPLIGFLASEELFGQKKFSNQITQGYEKGEINQYFLSQIHFLMKELISG